MPAALPKKTVCPHCGLTLVVSQQGVHQTIEYDMSEWQKRCRWQALQSPVLCLVRRGQEPARPH